jgi:hypothetical protein
MARAMVTSQRLDLRAWLGEKGTGPEVQKEMNVFPAPIVAQAHSHRPTAGRLRWRIGGAKIISGNGVAYAASGLSHFGSVEC